MSKLNILDVIDAEIEDRRADGDTGNVENLLEARAAMAAVLLEARRCCAGTGDVRALRKAVDHAEGRP